MPSWSVHLAVAKKVNKKLKLNDDLFLYGNLIPDVDKGTIITRYEAHYYNEKLPFPTVPQEKMIDINKFLSVYKSKLGNPLILGYYSHLLTDQFYNEKVYTSKWVQDNNNNIIGIRFNNKILKIDIDDKKRLKRKYKHRDFELYGKYLFNDGYVSIPQNINLVKENAIYLKDKFLTDELIDHRFNYLKNEFAKFNKLSLSEKLFKHNYKLFTKKELDNIMEECIEMIVNKIKESGEKMNKNDYIKIVQEKLKDNSKKIMIDQINNYYIAKEYDNPKHKYSVGDDVYLKKGTLLHGTYKNIDGLKGILKDGLISSWFIDGRLSKYPSSVGVWNLKKDYLLKDYVNFYSGGTIEYKEIDGKKIKTSVIPYDEMKNIMNTIDTNTCFRWYMEQTKEARFLPSLVQNKVQIGIIFNGNNKVVEELLKGDILSNDISDENVKEFVNPDYYEKFIVDRKDKDDFFTDRESAILFGVPANLIEGILVGREYEKNQSKLKEIKQLIPNAYICNLDGKVIIK